MDATESFSPASTVIWASAGSCTASLWLWPLTPEKLAGAYLGLGAVHDLEGADVLELRLRRRLRLLQWPLGLGEERGEGRQEGCTLMQFMRRWTAYPRRRGPGVKMLTTTGTTLPMSPSGSGNDI